MSDLFSILDLPDHDETDSFVELLYERLEKSRFEDTFREFLPADVIDKALVSDEFGPNISTDPRKWVSRLLGVQGETDLDTSLIIYILARAKRVFLICLLADFNHLHAKMAMFMEHEIDDDQLPFQTLTRNNLPDKHPFRYKRLWRPSEIGIFFRKQWELLAPIISTETLLHDFGQCIMPFISADQPCRSGAFGNVTKHVVHPAHFRDGVQQVAPSGYVLAVKEFRRDRKANVRQWENEVRILEKTNTLRHDHIVRFVTAFRYGEEPNLKHCICFEWASGGNLTDLWYGDLQPRLSTSLIRAVVQQLLGLAQALNAIHYFQGSADEQESFIHGDIKPSNILWFRDGGPIGTLKLADWGQAKVYSHYDSDSADITRIRHNTATRNNTTGNLGTRRYEPPEVETGLSINEDGSTKNVRSRLYDTWSFGCFSLEFIIWLLHGIKGLDSFRGDKVGDYGLSDSFYEINHAKLAKVHAVVEHWMDHLGKDAICRSETSALGDLLDIVRYGLLVVKLPQGGGSVNTRIRTLSRFVTHETKKTSGKAANSHLEVSDTFPSDRENLDNTDFRSSGIIDMPKRVVNTSLVGQESSNEDTKSTERFRAVELVSNLERVAQAEESDCYWYQDLPRSPIPPSFRQRSAELSHKIPLDMRGNYENPHFDPEEWLVGLDNDFAAKTFETLANAKRLSHERPSTVTEHLCEKCRDFQKDLWSPFLKITYSTQLLSRNAELQSCDLCVLLWQVCLNTASDKHGSVRFERRGSTIRLSHRRYPVLSLFQDYDPLSVVTDIQIGFRRLPDPGTAPHLGVLRRWLHCCDNEHWKDPKCKPSRFKESAVGTITKVPTRLLAVVTDSSTTVRLQEMKGLDRSEWVALSYRWGLPPHFSTTRRNLEKMYQGISVDELPRTFQDAVTITRELGQAYLWIDSLCIIQGEDGDFETESKTMEDVYNGAYCVLAASSAVDQRSGFLSPRAPRRQVTLDPQHDNHGLILVCEMIDNFQDHVLKGNLARRGWVLQEHALARRTIFFTEHQTYWECGHGVRCETMSTLTNHHASLLGDPDFPKRLEPAEHGEFVVRLQELMKQYTQLDLSSDYDRSTAIASLQQRLMRVMSLHGEYGIYESPVDHKQGLLRRSLLWHRSLTVGSLAAIKYPRNQNVPSWSWMSCSGPIDYFPLTFFGFDWPSLKTTWSNSAVAGSKTHIEAMVQEINLSAAKDFEADIIFDIPTQVDHTKVMAVVLGIEKGDTEVQDKRHYILVVVPKKTWGHALYSRVGAGHIPGRCLVEEVEEGVLI